MGHGSAAGVGVAGHHAVAEVKDLGDEEEQLEPAARELADVALGNETAGEALNGGAELGRRALGVGGHHAGDGHVDGKLDEEIGQVVGDLRLWAGEQQIEHGLGGAQVVKDGAVDIAAGDLGEGEDQAADGESESVFLLSSDVFGDDVSKHAQGVGVVDLGDLGANGVGLGGLAMGGALGEQELEDEGVGEGERDELGDEGVDVGGAVAHAVGGAGEVVAHEVGGLEALVGEQTDGGGDCVDGGVGEVHHVGGGDGEGVGGVGLDGVIGGGVGVGGGVGIGGGVGVGDGGGLRDDGRYLRQGRRHGRDWRLYRGADGVGGWGGGHGHFGVEKQVMVAF